MFRENSHNATEFTFMGRFHRDVTATGKLFKNINMIKAFRNPKQGYPSLCTVCDVRGKFMFFLGSSYTDLAISLS